MRDNLTDMTSPGAAPQADCLFCRILGGEIPADIVAESENAIAFNDINPMAPLHVLVIPREHYRDVVALAEADPDLLAEMVLLARQVAAEADPAVLASRALQGDQRPKTAANGDFRLEFNTGADSGQSVFHVHAHVLGGAKLGWSPA